MDAILLFNCNSLAGLLNKSNGDEDSGPEEDDGQKDDRLRDRYDNYWVEWKISITKKWVKK